MNLSDIQSALRNFSPLEIVRYARKLARKSRRGIDNYLEYAAEQMSEKLDEQDKKEKKLAAAGTPLSDNDQAQAVFNLHMEQLRDAFIAGGLYSLRVYHYDIDGGLDKAEQELDGLGVEQQKAKIKEQNEKRREERQMEIREGSGPELAETLERLKSGKGSGIGALKIVTGKDGEGDIEFLGEKPTPEMAEQLGKALTAVLKATATGQKGPIQVGDMTILSNDDDTPLNKMN